MTEVKEVELKGLRPLRRSRGMRQEDLAEAIGSDQYSVSQWERGIRSPRPTTIRKLAEALGVEPQDLFIEQPLTAPLAEPAPVEEVAALLRSRGGSEILIVDEEAFEALAAATDIPGLRPIMAELTAANRAAVDLMDKGGISREMRAALKEARKNFASRILALCNWAIRKEEEQVRELRAEADRLLQEANVPS